MQRLTDQLNAKANEYRGRSRVKSPLITNDPIYTQPQLKFLPAGTLNESNKDLSGQPVLLDRFGRIILEPTAFLYDMRLNSKSLETIRQYARILLDFFRLLGEANAGEGIEWYKTDNTILEKWKTYCTGPRKIGTQLTGYREVKPAVFNGRLALMLRFFLFAQESGWASGLIGSPTVGQFRISLLPTRNGMGHDCFVETEGEPHPAIPTDDDFDLVEASLTEFRKNPWLRERDRLISTMARTLTLRRLEIANMGVRSIPSRSKIEKFLKTAAERGLAMTIPIIVHGAKRSGKRKIQMTPSLVSSLRDYIDNVRNPFLEDREARAAENGKMFVTTDKLFVSQKGGALLPQSMTNMYKIAARRAGERHEPALGGMPLKKVRLHHGRHKSITDLIVGWMRGGMSAEEALFAVMDAAGIKSIDTAARYIHLANEFLTAESPEHQEECRKRDSTVAARLLLGVNYTKPSHWRGVRRKGAR